MLSTSSVFLRTVSKQRHQRFVTLQCLYMSSSAKEDGITSETTNSKIKKRNKSSTTTNYNNKSVFRADRVLANRGWGSRSECHDLIRQKRVFQKINSEMKRINGPSEKIPMDASLFVDGKIEVAKPPPLLRVYHKPKWVLSVMNDSKGRKHLGQLEENLISKMHPVGRLDYDTSGLILFSSEGTLTQTLLHPSNKIQKEYEALVVGNVNEHELRHKLMQGVETSMGVFPADLVSARSLPDDKVQPLIDDILKNLPPEYDLDQLDDKGYLFFKDVKELSEVRLTVEEGKHRMVRRILANSGYPVIGLKRLRLGTIHLDDLEEGATRELTEDEEAWANSLLKKK
jgi:23S rRNA pseudouridine2605 synthase